MTNIPFLWMLTLCITCSAVLGLFVAKRFIKTMHLKRHQEFVDAMVNVIGTLVAILLGFMVAAALQHYDTTAAEVGGEARSLADIYSLASGLPEQNRQSIQQLCLDYCNTVIDDEWKVMEKRQMSLKAWSDYRKLTQAIVLYKPADSGETNLHSAMIVSVQALGEGRRSRDITLTGRVYILVWPIITVASVILMLCTYLYATRGWVLHGVMLAFVAICLAMNSALLLMLITPFNGELKIRPVGFELDRKLFTGRL